MAAATVPAAQVVGKGVTVEVKDDKVLVTFDLTGNFGLSTSGKNVIIASTGGNVSIPGTDAKLGLNAYRAV
jgi:hypothetical protein